MLSIAVSDGGATHHLSFNASANAEANASTNQLVFVPVASSDSKRPNPFPTQPLPLVDICVVRVRQRAIDFITSNSAELGMIPIVFEVLYLRRGAMGGISIFNLITDTKSWSKFW